MADCFAKCLAGATPAPAASAKAPEPPPPAAPASAPAAASAASPESPALAPKPATPARALPTVSEDENAQEDTASGAGAGASTIEAMSVEEVLEKLGLATKSADAKDIMACCNRVRVLCRDTPARQRCEQLGAARIVVAAAAVVTEDRDATLQALAAIVNLCSGEAHSARITASQEGAVVAAATAAAKLGGEDIEVAEMACLLIQNVCIGEDNAAVDRRKRAAEQGAIEAIMLVMSKYPDLMGPTHAAMRLTVDRVPDSRTKALSLGAPEEAVKPVTKESGGGLLSFRGGLGTFRRKASRNKEKAAS